MIRYIPPFILNQYENKNYSGIIEGYVLFFDIADFTSIGNEFRKHGKIGAEELNRFLEEVFVTPIELVENNGGFISHFAGDAFCALFPATNPDGLLYVIKSLNYRFSETKLFISSLGDFNIGVRITVSMGKINWQIFQNDYQNEYVFYGKPLQEIAQLSSKKLNIAYSGSVLKQIGRNTSNEITPIPSEHKLNYSFVSSSYTKFCHKRLIAEKPESEIREAAYCFVDFSQTESNMQEEVLGLLHDKLDAYSGYFNKLDGTDKGLVGLIIFGLPKSVGNTLDRVCRFALEARQAVPSLGFGLSCGKVFAGFVGTKNTCEYTALGATVNLAARLMSKSSEGTIITDTFLQRDLYFHYSFANKGFIELKGFVSPVNIYQLNGLKPEGQKINKSEFVGREQELIFLNTILKCNSNTVIYVSGEAGMGKSRLVSEALNGYSKEKHHKFFAYCDPVDKKILEPVRQILRSYFAVDSLQTVRRNLERFRKKWANLAGEDKELIRIESIIGSLLGFEWANSVYTYLPPDERHGQLKKAFAKFISALAGQKTVIIHLDDPQWIEELTLSFLKTLETKNTFPVFIVCACRYQDLGGTVDMNLDGFQKKFINLEHLYQTDSSSLICHLLNCTLVPQKTLDLIINRAEGNPFFIEQLIAFLQENNLFDTNYHIIGDASHLITFNISDIIGNRLDNLSDSVRWTLQNASVLGLEFNTKLLADMLDRKIEEELGNGKISRMWSGLDEIRYIFAHVLIKDIAYQRMVTNRLKQLHLSAAEAMVRLFSEELDANAENIAGHYLLAAEELNASDYLVKAGVFYGENYDFIRAELNLKKALEIQERLLKKDNPRIAKSLHDLGYLYFSRGKYDQAELLYLRALEIREKIQKKNDQQDTANSLDDLGSLYYVQGKYEDAEKMFTKGKDLRERIFGSEHPETAISLNNLANLYHYQKKYAQAEEFHLRVLRIREKDLGSDHLHTVSSLNDLANLYHFQGKYDLAELLHLRVLETREKVLGSEHLSTAKSLQYLASLYKSQGKLAETQRLYLRVIDINEKVLGAEHPETLAAKEYLSDLLKKPDQQKDLVLN